VTALVTGAAGFLGTALVERLLTRGERDVRCLVRSVSRGAGLRALEARFPEARLEWCVGNLLSPGIAARALDGVGTVYHLAAGVVGAPADVFLDTTVASKRLLDAVAARGSAIKVVLVSSFGVYGVAGLPARSMVDESTPLEPHPERRDAYSHAKLRQELLFREFQAKAGFRLVVLRPGVIYGPGGPRISTRVGLDLAGRFLFLGGDNLLPLTFVESCADAMALAGGTEAADGQTFNVVDDDLVTAREFLSRYRREVRPLRVVKVPYPALQLLSRALSAYSRWSRGQLPAAFTPYRSATTWRPMRFSNARLKALGWRPLLTTEEGLRRTFEHDRLNPP
jgi:nucleoside-diphosphate-sugar epimerase